MSGPSLAVMAGADQLMTAIGENEDLAVAGSCLFEHRYLGRKLEAAMFAPRSPFTEHGRPVLVWVGRPSDACPAPWDRDDWFEAISDLVPEDASCDVCEGPTDRVAHAIPVPAGATVLLVTACDGCIADRDFAAVRSFAWPIERA